MSDQREDATPVVQGVVKWFDPAKGFGFILSDAGGPDILIHANVLRNYGQSSVADGSEIEVHVQHTDRGVQATEVITIRAPEGTVKAPLEDFQHFNEAELKDIPWQPARVKWFDKAKGFGFANAFGSAEDVFVHVEVLRLSGLADLQPGEAIAMRVVDGRRGKMAAEVVAWDVISRS
nr:cold shock protein [Cognatishimia sp. MH4019]